MNTGIGIIGLGSYLPMQTLTNDEVAARFGKTGQWIEDKTGILKRHVAEENDTVVNMAGEAGRRALRDAGLEAGDLGLIVAASSTPGRLVPSIACGVQRVLGAHAAAAADVNAACAGFMYALHFALGLCRSGQAGGPVLVVGSERYSHHLDYSDRRTASLFGDGAGAVVLGRVPHPYGIIYSHIGSDGRKEDYVRVLPLGNRSRDPYTLTMDGPATRGFIEQQIPALLDEVVRETDLTVDELDLVIPHQANIRLVTAVLEKAGVTPQQTWSTGHLYGNTGAASVPITLDSARLAGRVTDGSTVMLAALGAGMTWGTAVLRWRQIPERPSAL